MTVSIRVARPTDAGAIADIYNEAIRSTTATFDTEPKSEDDRLRWLESHDERHPVLVAELDNRVVGWAALTKWSDRPAYDQTAESSFYVGGQFRGRGIGRALKERLIEEARRIGYHSILARVAEASDASIRINQSFGFRHIGTMKEVGLKFGQQLDVHLMQLMLDDPTRRQKNRALEEELDRILHARKGHFVLESGHHSDLWLDLELLCVQPSRIEPFAAEISRRLEKHSIDVVCGPLVEGAFVALMTARHLDVDFVYTNPVSDPNRIGLFPVEYSLPDALRQQVASKRVAMVNDVINAGSAVRGTYADLGSCGANVVAMAALQTLGDSPKALARDWGIDLITLSSQPNLIWRPEECPLCAAGTPLDVSQSRGTID